MRHTIYTLISALFIGTLGNNAAAQELNFETPAVEEKKDSAVPTEVGPISNIQIGGAIDWRTSYQSGGTRPFSFIHVNEFVVSASVGDHISLSAEQLLLTSELGTVVGQDHGFATVSLIQLPFLPSGTTIKLGRFRGKFGLDAQVDSPANIFPSQALRSNGIVTDLGVNVDYNVGEFDFLVEAFNGADYLVNNGQKSAYQTKSLPVQARVLYQPASNLKLGLSGFKGETWDNNLAPDVLDVGLLGSRINQTRTIERERVALDVSVKTPVADLLAEGIIGRDKGRLSQPANKSSTLARGALLRTDIPLFRVSDVTRTKLAVQYDAWEDASYEGRVAFLSTAFSVLNDDGWIVRLGGTMSDVAFKKEKPKALHATPWSVTSQLLVSF